MHQKLLRDSIRRSSKEELYKWKNPRETKAMQRPQDNIWVIITEEETEDHAHPIDIEEIDQEVEEDTAEREETLEIDILEKGIQIDMDLERRDIEGTEIIGIIEIIEIDLEVEEDTEIDLIVDQEEGEKEKFLYQSYILVNGI